MIRPAGIIAAAGALSGCAALADVQLTPADGAAAYVREVCELPAADRRELAPAMDQATAPHRLRVECAR